MCGRYTLVAGEEQLVTEFDLAFCEPVVPNRNIRPTQSTPVIRQRESDGRRALEHLRWGLIPAWSKDPASGFKMINARSEEAAGKPAFRDAFRRRRCLVACNGFYEWKALEGAPKNAKKQPYEFRRPDAGLFALGGLWDRWQGADGKIIESFAIMTRSANELVAPIHDRMPVVIARSNYGAWLDARLTDAQKVQALLGGDSQENLICIPAEPL